MAIRWSKPHRRLPAEDTWLRRLADVVLARCADAANVLGDALDARLARVLRGRRIP